MNKQTNNHTFWQPGLAYATRGSLVHRSDEQVGLAAQSHVQGAKGGGGGLVLQEGFVHNIGQQVERKERDIGGPEENRREGVGGGVGTLGQPGWRSSSGKVSCTGLNSKLMP